MYAGIKYIPFIIGGVAAMVWGFPASHRLKSPFDIGAAFVVIIGIGMFLIGVLLTCIPTFFR